MAGCCWLPLACSTNNSPTSDNPPAPTSTPTSCANSQGTPCTPTGTPTFTSTISPTPTQTGTPTSTATPTNTSTATFTQTNTATPHPYVWSSNFAAGSPNNPTYLFYYATDNWVVVSNTGGNEFYILNPSNGAVSASTGASAPSTAAGFFDSTGGVVAYFASGYRNFLAADTNNNRVQGFTDNPSCFPCLLPYNSTESFGSAGSGNGAFNSPMGMALYNGALYVADPGNHRIQVFSAPSPGIAAVYSSQWSVSGVLSYQASPSSVAIDSSVFPVRVVVLDTNSVLHRVLIYTTTGSLITSWSTPSVGVGPGSQVAVDPSGNIFVADSGNNRILEYNPTGSLIYTINSGVCTGCFNYPTGLALDGSGNLFVADSGNNRVEEFLRQ